jgi:uncharacterized protein (DUF1015 family)
MAVLKPFKGIRPKPELAGQIASRPYDVLNSLEARIEAEGNPYTFLHIAKPEIDLDPTIDVHTMPVYLKAKENFENMISKGWMFQDSKKCYYIYSQTMWGKTQYGLVGGAGVHDYMEGVIKKHELTRPDKEEDRMNHVRVTDMNAEPVFFAYRDHERIDHIVAHKVKEKPVYDVTTSDEVNHKLWVIEDDDTISEIEHIFETEIPYLYVADGHHRTAAAARVGDERKRNNKKHNGFEEYNYFLSVNFPASQLRIIDYNRVVKDLNGMTTEVFIQKLQTGFDVSEPSEVEIKPSNLREFSMYLEGKWYKMTAKKGTYDDNDPIKALDVTILTEQVLLPLLDIKDLRTSNRIDFVGGIRGLGELKKRVDTGEMKAAFALFPVSMKQLMDIADNNLIMPPKVTWFEPKLRSGLIVHSLID